MNRYFTSEDVSGCLNDFLKALEARIFKEGCPPRPTALALEDPSAAQHETTSSGMSLIADAFQAAPVHIPNCGDGGNARHSYKSELSFVRDPKVGTKKMLWWHDKDPREIPHNHPWDFRSAVLHGGYKEERYWLGDDGELHHEVCEYSAGDVNVVPANVFHNVLEVQPGTVTFLDCGPARAGNEWGYLDTKTKKYDGFKEHTPANFLEIFRELNPHLIPEEDK